jgi:hypothetical protein
VPSPPLRQCCHQWARWRSRHLAHECLGCSAVVLFSDLTGTMPSFICSFPGEALLTSNFDTLHFAGHVYIYCFFFPSFSLLTCCSYSPVFRASCVLSPFRANLASCLLFYSVLYVADQASSFILPFSSRFFVARFFVYLLPESRLCAEQRRRRPSLPHPLCPTHFLLLPTAAFTSIRFSLALPVCACYPVFFFPLLYCSLPSPIALLLSHRTHDV